MPRAKKVEHVVITILSGRNKNRARRESPLI